METDRDFRSNAHRRSPRLASHSKCLPFIHTILPFLAWENREPSTRRWPVTAVNTDKTGFTDMGGGGICCRCLSSMAEHWELPWPWHCIMILPQLFRVLGEGRNQWLGLGVLILDQALVPSSCKSHLVMIHQEPNALVCDPENKNQYLCRWVYSLTRADEHGYSQFFSGSLPPASPTPTQLFFFVSAQIQRERNYFLNFSFYYVNICEQINCECGFHLFPCSGSHISHPTHWDPVHLAEMSRYSVGWL